MRILFFQYIFLILFPPYAAQIQMKLSYEYFEMKDYMGDPCARDPDYSRDKCAFDAVIDLMMERAGCTVPYIYNQVVLL